MGKAKYCDTINISGFQWFQWWFQQAQLGELFSRTKFAQQMFQPNNEGPEQPFI